MDFKTKKELTDTLVDYIANKDCSINFAGYIFKAKSGFTAQLNRNIYLKDDEILKEGLDNATKIVYENKYIKKGELLEFRYEYDAHCRDMEDDYWRIDQSILALKCEPFAKIREDIRFGNKHNLKKIIENKLYDEME